ncbi:MAG: hypothetical protein R3E32_02170 [Chitinophagales bacterium]
MKKINFATPILFSFWLTLFSCSSMPKERPSDFSIRLSDHGGMMPTGYSIELSSDSSNIDYHVFNAHNKVYFQLTDKELDSIYQLCVKQKFNSIKEKKEMVYDRGGTSINIRANGKQVQKSDAGTSFIRKKYIKRFEKIDAMVRKIAKDKTEPLKQNIEVHIEDSLLSPNTFIHFKVNSGGFTSYHFDSEKDGEQNSIEVPFYIGPNHVSVDWVEGREKKHHRQNIAANKFVINIADSTKQLYLLKDGDNIALETEKNIEENE